MLRLATETATLRLAQPFRISGYVDRLDLSDCGTKARVTDYKGGKCPKDPVTLDGGSEVFHGPLRATLQPIDRRQMGTFERSPVSA